MPKNFKDFDLLPLIQESLDQLGFTKPTEIQEKTLPLLCPNYAQDVHAQAQTGTGKTLAFGIPLLQAINPSLKAVQGLVIAPTRELVLQIYESLKEVSRSTGIIIEPIYGGMPINRQIEGIKRGAQIIVGTPGRLNDHLSRKTLSLKELKVLVLDEADIMLDMGFKEEIDKILTLTPKNRAIWLFSATVMPGIKDLIKSHMKEVVTIKAAHEKGVVSTQVQQYYCIVPVSKRVEAASRFIESAPDFYGIIFCKTKALTAEVMEQLASRGFRVNCLQGDMKQALRTQVIKGFKNKAFNVLVATDVAARGIDISDLTHVINFSIPTDHESYIHRIGRTGRAGKHGTAILFIAPNELHRIKKLEKIANTKIQEIKVPPLEAVIDAKMISVSDFIEQSKQPSTTSAAHKAIKDLINSFTDEEIKNAFACALERQFFKNFDSKDLSIINADMARIPQEICLEIGRDQGLDEDHVRDYLYTTCKLLPQDARKVRVLNNKTFISIPENVLHDCLKALKAKPIKPQPYKMYLVEDRPPEHRGRSDRKKSFGSPKPHRARKPFERKERKRR